VLFRYFIKRVISLIPVVLIITIMLFTIMKLMPGDPVRMMLNPALKAEQYETAYDAMFRKLGLDKSYPEQYVRWMGNIFQGELGWSSLHNKPVEDAVAEPMRNTIILNVFVIIIQLAITLPLGIQSAVKRGSFLDSFIQFFSIATYSMPSFFIALSLIFIFAINLGWLPVGSMPLTNKLTGFAFIGAWAKYMALPVTCLVLIGMASTIRYVRNAMLEALSNDYIRTARAKGLSEKVVIYSHAFRNALIPISTIVIWNIFRLFSGSAITETVFAWNGIGHVLVKALNNRDFALVTTMNLFFAVLGVTANLVADISYGLIDPRIKLE